MKRILVLILACASVQLNCQEQTPVCKPGEMVTRSFPPQCVKMPQAPTVVCKPGEVMTRSMPPQCIPVEQAPSVQSEDELPEAGQEESLEGMDLLENE